jgi:hypothetical protein
MVACFGHMKHDPAVAPFRDVVIQLQLEPVELLIRHQITSVFRVHTFEAAILHHPPGLHPLLFEVMPAAKIRAIKYLLKSADMPRCFDVRGFARLVRGGIIGGLSETGITNGRAEESRPQKVNKIEAFHLLEPPEYIGGFPESKSARWIGLRGFLAGASWQDDFN